LIVPTRSKGMQPLTLCVKFASWNAERPERHSHTERWNDQEQKPRFYPQSGGTTDPLFSTTVPEFESEEQAASYDRWFRAEVQKSLDDPRPNIPHEQVMAEIEALMEERRIKHEAQEALREKDLKPTG